jgi:hypothetical protein
LIAVAIEAYEIWIPPAAGAVALRWHELLRSREKAWEPS